MKIRCDVCETAAAAVLCCADETALCWSCDEKVHAANKLARMHQRVPLLPTTSTSSSSCSQVPACDICQEKAEYFFCLEERALLCRQCDVAIHTASPHVSSHQRFLITGVRVAPQHHLTSNSRTLASSDSIADKKLRASTSMEEALRPQWPWNEFLDGYEFDQQYRLSEPGSSS